MRHYKPATDFLTGKKNPNYKPDARKGDRHKGPRFRRQGFVAWDGESITDENGHSYIMLVSSDGDLALSDDPRGLSTVECFETLIKAGKRANNKFHVGFAFSYDVNMMLRDVPYWALLALWNNGVCFWNGYGISYRPRKEFSVWRLEDKASRIRIWDVWGFFQSSFVGALKAYGRQSVVDEIEAMKQRRSEFTRSDAAEMLAYCQDECKHLAGMMDQFYEYLQECDLRLTRYDGAGAVASALLKRNNIKDAKRKTTKTTQSAASHAYFGGRIELVRYGNTDAKIYQYDLRSAYPSIIQHLPCLAHGEWKTEKRNEISDYPFSLHLVEWNFDSATATVCPFPWRDQYGSIFFPTSGKGWYWKPEVSAALSALQNGVLSGSVKIEKTISFIPDCNCNPFNWVSEMYNTRAAWKAAGIGAEKVLKLGLNSLYGKFAQRIGYSDGEPPTWHQLEWAGYVTSATRARLYEASFPVIKSGDIIAYATDAIFATAPLDLPCENKLGNWEADIHNGGTFVQSGVYWVDNERVGHTRGFAKQDITPSVIIDCWQNGAVATQWQLTRFVGLGRALTSLKQWETWRTWVTEHKSLSLTPQGSKRILIGSRKAKPHKQLVLTLPADPHLGKVEISAPIKLPWLNQSNAFDADANRLELKADDESDSCYD